MCEGKALLYDVLFVCLSVTGFFPPPAGMTSKPGKNMGNVFLSNFGGGNGYLNFHVHVHTVP